MIASPCPDCGSTLVHRSHRIGLSEEMLSMAYVYPFRCQSCMHRFFSLQWGVRYQRRGLAPRGLTPFPIVSVPVRRGTGTSFRPEPVPRVPAPLAGNR
jgi:hypothetical protein